MGAHASDTLIIFEKIISEIRAARARDGGDGRGEGVEGEGGGGGYGVTRDCIARVLGGVEGEFAFCFWEARGRRLWFGRDR